MNFYLAIILIAIIFLIVIKNIIGKSQKIEISKTRSVTIMIIGIVGLFWSTLFNPMISIFSFGTVPLISLIFLISGIFRFVKIKKIQRSTIAK